MAEKLVIEFIGKDQVSQATKGIGKALGGLGSLALTAGAAAAAGLAALGGAAVGVGGKLVALGSDAAEMESKFNTVFGESTEEARAALDEFGNAVGRNTFELMGMAAVVQDTFVPMGFAREQAAGLSVDLVKLATDVASFNNVHDEQVMQDFQSALIGNHETVRKYGVLITEATLNQELMRMGIEEGTKAATEQEKVQARLNLITAGTTDAHGDAAKTAGGWANQMRALKAELSEAATAMGSELLPVVLPLLQNFVTWVREVMPRAVEIFRQFAGDLNQTLGPAMVMINDAVRRIAEAFGINTDEVSSADIVLMAFKATLDVIVIAIQAVAVVMQGLASGVEAIRRAVDAVIGKWGEFKNAVRGAVDAIPDWLIPGSPTPFELGLRGIARSLSNVNAGLGTTGGGMTAAAPVASGGGVAGGAVVVQLQYSPNVSFADRFEAEQTLVPYVESALRKLKVSGTI